MTSKFAQKLLNATKNLDTSNPVNKNINKDYLLQKDLNNSEIMNSYKENLKNADEEYIKNYNKNLKYKPSNVKNNNKNLQTNDDYVNRPPSSIRQLRNGNTVIMTPWGPYDDKGGKKSKKTRKQKKSNKKQRKTRKH